MAKSAFLLFDDQELHFEAVTSEETEHTATVTEHPVEEGANITDHIRDMNDKLTLEVVVSNHPITDINNMYSGEPFTGVELDVPKWEPPLTPTPGALFSAIGNAIGSLFGGAPAYKAWVLKFPAQFNAVQDVMNMLTGWKEVGQVGSVILPWKTFESMVITSVTPQRSAEIGDAAKIKIMFQQIRVVESKLVTAPVPTESRGKVAVNKGRQGVTVKDPKPKASLLSKILGK